MRNFIFVIEASKVVTVGMAAYFFIFGAAYAAEPQDVCAGAPPQLVRSVNPPPFVTEAVERAIRFHRLVAQWHEERGATSLMEEMYTRPAYLSIMAMGPEVVRLIIRQLRLEGENPDHWFVALHYITEGVDPVPDEDKGDLARMSKAWLEWAEQDIDVG